MESYKELKVWQRSMALAEQVYGLTQYFPAEERYGLTSQMRRAAVSIPANIAEGWGRGTTRDYLNFLIIARGSLMELETQLILASHLGYVESVHVTSASREIAEIGKMLNSLIASLKHRHTHEPNP